MKYIRTKLSIVMLVILSGCGSGGSDLKVEACVSRGIAYFKEIGSYPTLKSVPNTGRRAEGQKMWLVRDATEQRPLSK